MRIIETLHAVTREEDWSRVRSPGRARRRQRKGHRQNIKVVEKPAAYELNGTMFVHPAIAAELRRHAIERRDDMVTRAMYGVCLVGT